MSLLYILPAAVRAQFTFSTNTDGTLTLTYYSGPAGSVIIPSTVNGAPVTGIGPYAFVGHLEEIPVVTNIWVPASVTNLTTYAFYDDYSYEDGLQEVYFEGNAPAGSNAVPYNPTFPSDNAIIYHLAGTTGFDTNFYLGPIEVWYPGELQVGLSPTNAVLEGAEWQVDGGPWQTNGAIVSNLSPGNHTVSFRAIAGWTAPANEMVNVGTDFITVLGAPSYSPLPGGPSQTIFQVLHTFAATPGGDGGSVAPLTLISNVLYGSTASGIFTIQPDGSGYTIVVTNNGGGGNAGLIESGGMLFGTTGGTVFRINPDGSGFTNLVSGLAGAEYGVTLVGNTLYATTSNGGPNNGGTLFAVNTDGTGYRILHLFDHSTNNDGVLPLAGVVAVGNTLYGDTQEAQTTPYGFIYAIQTDGTGYTNFPYAAGYAGNLALSGNVIYGYTGGNLFRMNVDGSGYTILPGVNTASGVLVAGNTLYGTATFGPQHPWEPGYYGTIFAVHTDGTGFTNLYYFSGNSDGAQPEATPLLVGTTLYGTTPLGGTNDNGVYYDGNGTVYMLSFPHPQLGMSVSGTNLVFSWPSGTAGAGYDLFSVQSTTNLTSPCAWCALPMAPVLVNGMNTVTNPIPATATLYRLSQ